MITAGSLWRKWDLQIHSLFSILNNQFGNDTDAYVVALFRKILEVELLVAGITDYFSIKGYRIVIERQLDNVFLLKHFDEREAAKIQAVCFIPNIEFRLNILVNNRRVNFHILLSEHLRPDTIENDFLHRLEFEFVADAGLPSETRVLTENNLSLLGQRLKRQQKEFAKYSDFFAGTMNVTVNSSDIIEQLSSQRSIFEQAYLVAVPGDEDLSQINWSSQGHQTRKLLIQQCHLLFSNNANTMKWGLGEKSASTYEFVEEFKSIKPALRTSDAHKISEIGMRWHWIKADPGFRGLRQALLEPYARIDRRADYRDRPEPLQNSSRIIRQVTISPVHPNEANPWFNCSLHLNPGLVSIIGNKGSGKSALLETLGLIGNTDHADSFSFLSESRFLNQRYNLGSKYRATLVWADSTEDTKLLNERPEVFEVAKVTAIPQGYFEEVCNDIAPYQQSDFHAELKKVLFQHVPEAERLGEESLDAVLKKRLRGIEARLDREKERLAELNRSIAEAEKRKLLSFHQKLQSELDELTRDIRAHIAKRPKAVADPISNAAMSVKMSKATQDVAKARERLAKIEANLEKNTSEISRTRLLVNHAELLKSILEGLSENVVDAQTRALTNLQELGLKWENLIEFKLKLGPLERTMQRLQRNLERLYDRESTTGARRLPAQKESAEKKLNELVEKLNAPNRSYQEYLSAHQEWEVHLRPKLRDRVKKRKECRSLSDLPEVIEKLRENRREVSKEIYRHNLEMVTVYRDLYGPAQAFLRENAPGTCGELLTFNVGLGDAGFANELLGRINQRRRGPFSGVMEGQETADRMIRDLDMEDCGAVIEFMDNIVDKMLEANPGTRTEGYRVEEQLRDTVTVVDFYNFVYGLSFIKPQYVLQWSGKELSRLSPGERGTLLLVFYLVLDLSDCPLLIDQPEENLDNQTLYQVLGPCLRMAAKRRQVIIVTHNPNLAVVCDSDQIIVSEMDRQSGARVQYRSGSIENSDISSALMAILEGTRPAFENRDKKYEIGGSR